jgi:DNA-binding transcriptional MerR regulator
MDASWTLPELVAEAASWIATLPEPKNGQVRAVPDERTIRYYAALGLLDRPAAMRGRTALYSRRHLAQVIAIKRLQGAGKSLADIQTMWPTLDDLTLARLTGVRVPARARASREEFWKREATRGSTPPPAATPKATVPPAVQTAATAAPAVVRVELAPNVHVDIALPEGASLASADVHALRAAAAPFVAELAKRGLTLEEES